MSRPSLLRQFELRDDASDTRLVCWLPDDGRVVIGATLTLKETGDTIWRVAIRYGMTKAPDEIPRAWRVGGL